MLTRLSQKRSQNMRPINKKFSCKLLKTDHLYHKSNNDSTLINLKNKINKFQ